MTKERIEFECTHCGAGGKAAAKLAGKKTRCPKCKSSIVIGAANPSHTPTSADLNPQDSADDLAGRADELFGDLDIDNLDFDENAFDIPGTPATEIVASEPEPKPKPPKKRSQPAQPKKLPKKRPKPAAKRPPQTPVEEPAEHELEDLEIPTGPISESSISESPILFDSPELPDAQEQLDEMDAIKIDEAEVETDGVFGIPCKICDTRIHVKESQVGSSVECPMCFTGVEVPEPSKEFLEAKKAAKKLALENPEEKTRAAKRAFAPAEEIDDGGFKLSEAVDRPPVDYSIEEGYGLNPVEEDLLTAPVELEESDILDDDQELTLLPPTEIVTASRARSKPDVVVARSRRSKQKQKSEKQKTEKQKTEKPKPKPEPEIVETPAGGEKSPANRFEFSDEGEKHSWPLLLEWLRPLTKNSEFLIRAAMATLFLSLGYLMFDILFGIAGSDNLQSADKFVQGALPAIGGTLCMAIAALTLCIIFAVIYRDAASDNKAYDNWIGFEVGEWMGSFAFVGFSVWLASIPGLVAGNIGWAATETISTLFICTAISVFVFSPVFLIAALYNDAVMHVFSMDIFKTFQSDTPGWIAMLKFVGLSLLIFLVGFAILCVPFFPVNFIGAAIHVFNIVFFALVIGLQARRVISRIQKADEY